MKQIIKRILGIAMLIVAIPALVVLASIVATALFVLASIAVIVALACGSCAVQIEDHIGKEEK